ncbi:MAG: YceD family protein [Pseudomonadota bacterium]
MSVLVIDPIEFSRLRDQRQGEIAVSGLTRLAAELIDDSGTLTWSLKGGSGKLGYPQLTIAVSGSVQLRCQRCLAPLAFTISSESLLILAPDEASADSIDALLDDDTIDVIVAVKELDVVGLIEDEALLALPLAPKHEICPDEEQLDALKNAKSDSPFSVLKNLKP